MSAFFFSIIGIWVFFKTFLNFDAKIFSFTANAHRNISLSVSLMTNNQYRYQSMIIFFKKIEKPCQIVLLLRFPVAAQSVLVTSL